ncbi:Centrin-1 [Holothuria leucospilota]|uniref:Centrin-1 n=1 Tax=Holothuria leucospilota TaxID=206669 RepID=A0A9Q1BTU1_HOLLE|nr:Centrin-1 [Holothuria leucospilota]
MAFGPWSPTKISRGHGPLAAGSYATVTLFNQSYFIGLCKGFCLMDPGESLGGIQTIKFKKEPSIRTAIVFFFPDGKGRLCAEDLMRAAGMVGVKLTDRMAQEMVLEADQNGDGLVNKKEFIDVMRQTNLYC